RSGDAGRDTPAVPLPRLAASVPRREPDPRGRAAARHGLRRRLDTVHRAHPGGHPHPGRRQRHPHAGRRAVGRVLAGPGRPVPGGRPVARPVHGLLQGVPALPAVGGAGRRRDPRRRRRPDGDRHLHGPERLPHQDHARLAHLAPMTEPASATSQPGRRASGGGPALTLRGVRRRMGRETVLAGIDLEVAAGRLVVLRGSNGSGKTTLLRLLATRLRPHAGTASVFGHDLVSEAEAVRGRVGLLSVTGGSYPVLTGRENLGLTTSLTGKGSDDDAEAALTR